MASIKAVEEATQDFTVPVAALRDDVAKLSSSLSEFIRTQTATTTRRSDWHLRFSKRRHRTRAHPCFQEITSFSAYGYPFSCQKNSGKTSKL
jgi:hypothetical protein